MDPIKLFKDAVKVRHPHYERVTDVATFAAAVMSGNGQDDELRRTRKRESDDQFDQRVRIFNSYTPFAAWNVQNTFSKVRRTKEAARRILEHQNERAKRIIEDQIAKAWAGQSLDDYLFDVLEYYTFWDPNAWLIIEQRRERDADGTVQSVQVYPLEVTSDQVVNYSLTQGVVNWLLIDLGRMEGKLELSNYYLYLAGKTLHAAEYKDEPLTDPGYQSIITEDESGKTRSFSFKVYETGTKSVPAVCMGAYLDGQTGNSTYITPLEPAKQILSDLIRNKSYYDNNLAEHFFPQKYVYSKACSYEDPQTGSRCEWGEVDGHTCPSCGGTGADYHTSEQDVIVVRMPEERDGLVPLNQLAHYVDLPAWLPPWQAEQIDKNIALITISSLGANKVDKPVTPATATERVLDLEEVYDRLSKYAALYSLAWMTYVKAAAEYLSVDNGLTCFHAFPRDFKLKTLEDLILEYSNARSAGLPYPVLEKIERDIIAKQNVDDQVSAQKNLAFRRFLPFKDKSDLMIARILSDRAADDYDRVLYENSDRIAEELDADSSGEFYLYPLDQQRRLLAEKVEEFASRIKYLSMPGADFAGFGAQNEPEPMPEPEPQPTE